jgi:putative hydrolase of the HAD superfamily
MMNHSSSTTTGANNWPAVLSKFAPLRAIIFDLDDTLYPERDFVLSGFRAVVRWSQTSLDIPAEPGYRRLLALYESGVRGHTFNRWLAGFGHSEQSLVEQCVHVYRQHNPDIRPFDGVPRLLQDLTGEVRLGLVSDGYLAVQKRKLFALALAPYLDAVVFSDEWGRQAWKPDPRPFQAILQRLDLAAGQAIYVADNPLKDFYGARRLGLVTAMIKRPAAEYSHLQPPTPDHAPDAIIDDLTLLTQLVN